MKLLLFLLGGFVSGAYVSWLCMRATLRNYKNYIHSRIDQPQNIAKADSSTDSKEAFAP